MDMTTGFVPRSTARVRICILGPREDQDMRPLSGEYKLLYGGDSQNLKTLDYQY